MNSSIYSINCSCDKKSCPIKNKKLNKLIKKARLEMYMDEKVKHRDGNNALGCISIFEDKDYGGILKATSLCQIVQFYILINESFKYTIEINKGNKEYYENKITEEELFRKEYSKLKIQLSKSLNSDIELKKTNRKLNDIIKDNINEIKGLKAKNKKLEKLITNMKFNSDNTDNTDDTNEGDTDEGETDESDTDDSPINGNISPNYYDIIQPKTSETPNYSVREFKERSTESFTLLKYERIKQYMISKNISLNRLCYNSNRNRADFRKLFLKLQIDRLNIAHPIYKPIETDNEFFNVLLN